MNFLQSLRPLGAFVVALVLTGCATTTTPPVDYTSFKAHRPRSILVLPPLNQTPDVKASDAVLSVATRPLAEAGYYVMPVALVGETFRQNGVTQPAEMHATSAEKLRNIFGADAVLYTKVVKYGTVYQVVSSDTVVSLEARLVDLKSGEELWKGEAAASSGENQQHSGGIASLLISAVVNQIVASTFDNSRQIAGIASTRLLSPGRPGGLLYGPRSPKSQTP